jgi:hypothetical protein
MDYIVVAVQLVDFDFELQLVAVLQQVVDYEQFHTQLRHQ